MESSGTDVSKISVLAMLHLHRGNLHRPRKNGYNHGAQMNSNNGSSKILTRRELVKLAAGVPLLGFGAFPFLRRPQRHTAKPAPAPSEPSPFYQVDEAFLEELGNANFRYFWEQANPDTGIVRDRCNAIKPDKSDLGSIAAGAGGHQRGRALGGPAAAGAAQRVGAGAAERRAAAARPRRRRRTHGPGLFPKRKDAGALR